MSGFLLDTNVVSELTKDAPNPRVVAFLTEQDDLWLSALVLHELEFGLELLLPGQRRDGLRSVLSGFIATYEDRILPLERTGAERAAQFRAQAHRSGRVLDLGDALIAGTAKVHGLSVATRNVGDFADLDVDVINPWEDALTTPTNPPSKRAKIAPSHRKRRMEMMQDVADKLDRLERDGYVLIEGALSPQETELVRQRVDHARNMGWEEGLNAVGNMWFDSLLDREPETFAPLVGHPSVRPYLEGMMGKQCQLRSLRAHINPGPYLQEWHMDFYGYWEEKRQVEQYRLAAQPVGVNTTYYLQDNGPGDGHLKYVKNGHLQEPPHLYPKDRPKFAAWCEAQEHVVLYPKAGDCVVFLSHIPHQGAKERDDMERSNVVCHYQMTPMHEGVWHVSRPRGYDGTFPFA